MMVDTNDREINAGTLSIRTHHDGSTCTVALAGELDLANAERLSGELERVETDGAAPGGIVVDMTELEFIDSTGIAILLAAHQRLNADGERFRLRPSRAVSVCRVLAVTGVDEAIPYLDSPEGAAGAAPPPQLA